MHIFCKKKNIVAQEYIFCKKKYCCTGIQKYCPFNQVIHGKGTGREGGSC